MAPALRWDESWIARREREFQKTHAALPARLWLSVGSDDESPRVEAAVSFFQQIEASQYRALSLRSRRTDAAQSLLSGAPRARPPGAGFLPGLVDGQ
jgi:hypothetical protein